MHCRDVSVITSAQCELSVENFVKKYKIRGSYTHVAIQDFMVAELEDNYNTRDLINSETKINNYP